MQDVPPPEGGLVPVGEDIDDDEESGGMHLLQRTVKTLNSFLVPVQITHHEEDQDMASDDEGSRFGGGVFNADAGMPFGAPFINISTGREPPPVFLSRRNRTGISHFGYE